MKINESLLRSNYWLQILWLASYKKPSCLTAIKSTSIICACMNFADMLASNRFSCLLLLRYKTPKFLLCKINEFCTVLLDYYLVVAV